MSNRPLTALMQRSRRLPTRREGPSWRLARRSVRDRTGQTVRDESAAALQTPQGAKGTGFSENPAPLSIWTAAVRDILGGTQMKHTREWPAGIPPCRAAKWLPISCKRPVHIVKAHSGFQTVRARTNRLGELSRGRETNDSSAQ